MSDFGDLEAATTLAAELRWVVSAVAEAGGIPTSVSLLIFSVTDAPERLGDLRSVLRLENIEELLERLRQNPSPGPIDNRRELAEAVLESVEDWLGPRVAKLPLAEQERLQAVRLARVRVLEALTTDASMASPRGDDVIEFVMRAAGPVPWHDVDAFVEQVEVALGATGEYVGQVYDARTGVFSLEVVGCQSWIERNLLPLLRQYAGKGSYYVVTSRGAEPRRIEF